MWLCRMSIFMVFPVSPVKWRDCTSRTLRLHFLRNILPIQLAFPLFTVSRIFLSSFPPWLYAILLRFSHDRSNLSSSYSNTIFKKFPGISDLLAEVSKFQNHTKLCSKSSILLLLLLLLLIIIIEETTTIT
jgi:hypothetical protein